MQQVLESILTFFQGIISLIANLLHGIAQLIIMIPQALAFIGTSLGALPSIIAVFAVAMITVSVVYLVIGR